MKSLAVHGRHFLAAFLILALLLAAMPVFAEGQTEESGTKKIALTFDDGPHPYDTDKILDILAKYSVKATFFVIGENALQYPAPLQRAVAEGHEIGNHTFSHPKLREQNAQGFMEELQAASRAIYQVAGVKPILFRPPEGFREGVITTVAKEQGYETVLWSVDTRDWAGTSAASIEKSILTGVKDGSIILCHDYVVSNGHTAEALSRVIPILLEEGYEFVTVGELLGVADG